MFESFEKEIGRWKDAIEAIPETAKDLMFIEAITNAENEEVKEFYVQNIMNNESLPKTLESVMAKLKDHFGKSEKQKWDSVFRKISSFSFGERNLKQGWTILE